MSALTYDAFLRSKVAVAPDAGMDVPEAEIHPKLFPHQRDAVRWALRGGRRALFLRFGLGKTWCQLEIARHLIARHEGQVLIVLPLGVRREFMDTAPKLGIEATYVRNDEEARAAGRVLITNYERVRDGHLSPAFLGALTGVLLDEASVLRSFGSKTYQTFTELFRGVPFRFVSTATPSPNRHKELIHYAGFLGVMDTGQALTRFFQRNSEKAGDLTLIPHKEKEFWLWMSSWGLFVTKPSDLGYSDSGYDLPPLKVHWHSIDVSHVGAGADSWGQQMMFRDAAAGVTHAAREKRDTLPSRLARALEIIDAAGPDEHWLLWHHLEAERHAIEVAFRDERKAGSVATAYGSQDLEEREDVIAAFADGALRILATKPEIAGSGTNLQRHCHRAVFLGVDYSFNDFIQAAHRIYRFQQPKPVEIHVIYADSGVGIVRTLKKKWAEHEETTRQMTDIVKQFGLSEAAKRDTLERSIGVDRREVTTPYFSAIHNDCVAETAAMPENSVDMVLTSIPFSNQYEYTPSYNDFGHNSGDDAFFAQMDFLVPNLLRILKPGRVCAVHVKDRIRFGNVTGLGMPSVNRFSDKTADLFEKHGFICFGRITVVTDVVRENNQTYRLGWSEMCKDGTKMGAGMPEYVLLFRKLPSDTSRAYADEPVTHAKDDYTRAQWQVDAHGFWRSSGDRFLRPDEIAALEMDQAKAWYERWSAAHPYDYREHVALGKELEAQGRLPATFMLLAPSSWSEHVWTDIVRMRTLNTDQSIAGDEKHVCPLQLDLIERLIGRYTNPKDRVLDPFGGLMSVPYVAVKNGRYGIGVELNPEYWWMGTGHLRAAEEEVSAPTLFDAIGEPAA